MKKWFNILPEGDNACKILLYGYISDWEDDANAKGFVTELADAESKYKKINIHINSGGGSVLKGWPYSMPFGHRMPTSVYMWMAWPHQWAV
ncbi:MAG: hypothetical protein R2764_01480 [Bacteroidales bacterium]